MKKSKIGLSFSVITLALLVALSFVAISHSLIKSGKENPSGAINVSVSENDSDNNADKNNDKTENIVSEEPMPEVELIGGKSGVYHKEIQIFSTEYDEKGEITVKSDAGDKVVAPGTENSYDLYVRNVGDVPISYVLEAQSFLTVNMDGKETELPIEASFSNPKNNYLLGSEEGLEHLSGLDGVTDNRGLSPERQAKYTLTWGWPFDGDDEFDTLLGNLAAEGEDLTVKVAFNVTAAYDPDAEGGSPITGDTSIVGLWVALFVVSTFILIILLFRRKSEQDEENSQRHKENS